MYAPENIDLLLVDDDEDFRGTVARRFVRRGFRVQQAPNGERALALAKRQHFDVAILDLVMPGMTGVEVLGKLKSLLPDCEALLLTGQGTVDTAVEAMKQGAFDYLTKPFPLAELEILIERAYERRQLRKENKQLKLLIERSVAPTDMVGKSVAMQQLFRLIARSGPTDKAILIQGESGTGKELVARALHQASQRQAPAVEWACGLITA